MEWSSPDSVIGKPVVERSAYEQIKDASRFSNDSAKQEALLAEAKHDHTVLRTSGHLRFNRAFVMRCVAANGHALGNRSRSSRPQIAMVSAAKYNHLGRKVRSSRAYRAAPPNPLCDTHRWKLDVDAHSRSHVAP